MIRILNVSSDRNIGGAGRCILNFLRYYDRENFKVDVAVPKGSLLVPEIQKLGAQVIEVDGIGDKSLDFGAIRELKRVIRERNPQVVHTHGAMSGRIAGRQCGKKVVYTRHSVFPVSKKLSRPPGKWINGLVNAHYADAIIAVAEAAKENLVESGVRADRIQVILNGVEAQTRLSADEILAEKAKYGIPPDRFVAGILARMEHVKGHRYLLEAARMLKDEGKAVTIVVAGVGSLEDELKRQAAEMGLGDTVVFAGFVTDVRRILSIMDIQLNASFGTEATSLALLEGMSMGIPAVVTNYGGNPGVISAGVNGLLVPTKDSGALKEAISEMMENENAYIQMQASCLDVFQEKFTAEIYARNIEAVYCRAAGKRG